MMTLDSCQYKAGGRNSKIPSGKEDVLLALWGFATTMVGTYEESHASYGFGFEKTCHSKCDVALHCFAQRACDRETTNFSHSGLFDMMEGRGGVKVGEQAGTHGATLKL